jgi:hypothetical protein
VPARPFNSEFGCQHYASPEGRTLVVCNDVVLDVATGVVLPTEGNNLILHHVLGIGDVYTCDAPGRDRATRRLDNGEEISVPMVSQPRSRA